MKFPPLEPFASGYLPVTDGNEIYWETSGNPHGVPALYLHGGPGSGIMTGYRRYFDPEKFLIVSFEQRGCGRSTPLVTDTLKTIANNTTQALISDIEKLRIHLQVEKWLLTGMSWGTTLAFAYAEAHPDRVNALALAAVTTTTRLEVEWITEQMRRIFPDAWEKFSAASHAKPGQRMIDAYYHQITHPDPVVRERAAEAWCKWEDVHVSLNPNHQPYPNFEDPEFRLIFATLVIHYWKHSGFLDQADILENIDRIQHLPCTLIHGRRDISSPLETSWELHKALPMSRLVIVEEEGHGGEKMIHELIQSISLMALS